MSEMVGELDISLHRSRVSETKPAITPAFEKEGIPYFIEVPHSPETTPRQTILL